MLNLDWIVNLPGFQLTGCWGWQGISLLFVDYTGPNACPECKGSHLRSKGRYLRVLRHHSLRGAPCYLLVRARKSQCRDCGRHFRQRFPGVLSCQRATEAYREHIFGLHRDGLNRSCVGRREGLSSATVQRWFQHGLGRQFAQWHPPDCPRLLGIDEHFFTRKKGFATTLCDLKNHKIYDVVLGRSELSLEAYFLRLQGKQAVQVVCMDLAAHYRSLVRKHFPNARIVADRFHVVRLVNHHFLACWRDLDPVGSRNRGLLSLMRRHRHNCTPEQQERLDGYLQGQPALGVIYRFKHRLMWLLLQKQRTRRQCSKLIPRFLRAITALKESGLSPLVTLGETLNSWKEEIAGMWRFRRNNGITEGFHNKMELINRQAYGFRNFENYRMRVKVLCS